MIEKNTGKMTSKNKRKLGTKAVVNAEMMELSVMISSR
jgi:hypothetical protein